MMRILVHVVILALAGMGLSFAPAGAAVTVNCGLGDSISAALASGETYLTVNGTCTESVFVNSDDVTIESGVSGVIDGALTVWGAQRFTFRNMAVIASTEGLEGIWITHGASVNISDITVSGEPEECAILVYLDSFAEISDSTIDGNAYGLCVSIGSLISGWRNTVTNTQYSAVEVSQHGTYRARGDNFGASASGVPTISLSRNSYLDLRPAYVTGDIAASDQSHLRVRRSSTVTGNIGVDILSELDISGGSTVTGNVTVTNLSVGKATTDAVILGEISCTKSICMREAASPATAGYD